MHLAPMKATASADLPSGSSWRYEVKWDGMRALVFIDQGALRVQSSNLLDVTVMETTAANTTVKLGEAVVTAGPASVRAGDEVKLTIRPERIELLGAGTNGPNVLPGIVDRVVYAGPVLQVLVHLAAVGEIQVVLSNQGNITPHHSGEAIAVRLPADALRVLA